MRILIAEDDQVLADGLLRTLRGSGAAVDHVASGTEADAALMTNTEFDLLILDLGLPKMHGLEVLKKLRARGSSLPVLILTAADRLKSASRAWTMVLTITWPSLSVCRNWRRGCAP
jgi:two-component system OmpR family response regulator